MCSARLSCRSPLRFSRCWVVPPEEGGTGDAPANVTNAASNPEPAWMGPADQDLCGADRSDAGLGEQLRLHHRDEWFDVVFDVVGFLTERQDAQRG